MSGQGDTPTTGPTAPADVGFKPPPEFTGLLPGKSAAESEIILAHCFNLFSLNERKTLAQVCPFWQTIIVSKVGVPLCIGHGNSHCWDEQARQAFEHPQIVGQIATPFLTVSEMTHPVDQLHPIKYPGVVKTLLLDGNIGPTSFTRVIGNPGNILSNLATFAIDWTTMKSLSLKGLALSFPSLRALHVCSRQTREAAIDLTNNNWELGLENVQILLEQAKYPKLKKLFITFLPIHAGQDAKYIIAATVKCIATHKKTLKKLLLDFIGIHLNHPATAASNQQQQPIIDLSTLAQSCHGLNLTHGMIRCDADVRGNINFGVLGYIITQSIPLLVERHRVGLESVYLDLGLYPVLTATSLQALQLHAPTLMSIEMDVSPDGAIDCSVFRECKQLKVLTLIGRGRRHTRSDENLPELIETTQLPTSIESLRLIRLRITRSNADFLVMSTRARFLELQSIGQIGGLGLSLQAIERAMQNRTIHKLNLCKAINLDQFAALQPDSYRTSPLGTLVIGERLEADPDYQLGIWLRQHPETGALYYEMDWDEGIDESLLWSFTGSDPKLYFPSTPFDVDSLDANNDAEEDDQDEEMEEENDGEEEEESEMQPVEEDAAEEDAENTEGEGDASIEDVEQDDEPDSNNEDMDLDEAMDEDDEDGDDEWQPQ